MEYKQFNILLDELVKMPDLVFRFEKIYHIEIYRTKIRKIQFGFFGECRQNLIEDEHCISHFDGLIDKLETTRRDQFEIKHTEKEDIIFFKPLAINICEIKNHLYRHILEVRLTIFQDSIDHLNKFILDKKLQLSEKTSLSKSTPPLTKKNICPSFKLKLEKEDVKELFQTFLKSELIEETTNIEDFIKIFTGEEVNNKIVWLGHQNELSFLIKSIDRYNIEPLKKDIWETTIKCFKPKNGRDYNIKQLRHTTFPKDKERTLLIIKFLSINSV